MKSRCVLCCHLSYHEKSTSTAIMHHFWKTTAIVPRLWCILKNTSGVCLSHYRFGSDQGAPQQWGPGYFVSGAIITARAQQASMWEISTPIIEGGGKQKPK